jgi:hypothetical protein
MSSLAQDVEAQNSSADAIICYKFKKEKCELFTAGQAYEQRP